MIIDGNNQIHRAFWIATKQLKDGFDLKNFTIYTFLKNIKSFTTTFNTMDDIYCVWDSRLRTDLKNFRKTESSQDYKAGRNKEHADLINECANDCVEILNSLGIKNMFPYRMEADDCIAWLADNLPGRKVIIGNDKDFYQLIKDDTFVYNPITKKAITLENFELSTEIRSPQEYLWFRAFTGDKSDNINGIFRFGIKSFQKLAETWDFNLETADISDENKKLVEENYKLMDLRHGYSYYPEEVQHYKNQLQVQATSSSKNFKEYCKSHNMNSILSNMGEWSGFFRHELVDIINSWRKS